MCMIKKLKEWIIYATPATCMTPARYYKSCICGAKGTEAFAATGTHLGHAYIEVKNPQFLREKQLIVRNTIHIGMYVQDVENIKNNQ